MKLNYGYNLKYLKEIPVSVMEAVKNNLHYFKSKVVYSLFTFMCIVIIADFAFPLPDQKPYSRIIYSKDGTLLSAYLSKDDKWRMHSHLEEISPELIKAVINKEDKAFYWHPGFNPVSIVRALFQNLFSNRRVSGASTITMQVARMLDPSERTYSSKLKEILRAFQLEIHYSKKEILEMYLSMLPYGGNVEGVKAASYIFFNRPPNRLSLSQSILMAVIPNNPNLMRLDKDNVNAIKMRNKLINKFSAGKVFRQSDLTDALNEPAAIGRYQIKSEAPHFCLNILQYSNEDEIKSSLDFTIQKNTEKLLANYVNRVKARQVSNGAAIVIDNRSNSVVAYCGSADFYDAASSGQVNGIQALRSPGSTLKPILYTYAFDNGMLTPEMKMLDVPTEINGYEPENFDYKFNGEVTAKYALINSLNIPAVRLLKSIELGAFISLLEKGGFYDISPRKKAYGLSLILGGCGVRLEQLARFFTVFATEGVLYPLNYFSRSGKAKDEGVRIFSPGAAYITSQILSTNERPDFPSELLYSTNLPKIAWKTGTSFGKKDAWAVGYNPKYTIAVWMGNFNGIGAPELSGAEMAVPLLFDLFNSVDYGSNRNWFNQPEDVGKREVCSETGLLIGENCFSYKEDYYLKKKSPNMKCSLYKSYYVNDDESIQYCTVCLPDSHYKKVLYPNYEPELLLWYAKNKIPFKRPPPHNPYCTAKFSGNGPKIISPSADYEYLLESGSSQKLLLQATSDMNGEFFYWYINDVFYEQAAAGKKIFFKPAAGNNKITCLDNMGRKTTLITKVTYY